MTGRPMAEPARAGRQAQRLHLLYSQGPRLRGPASCRPRADRPNRDNGAAWFQHTGTNVEDAMSTLSPEAGPPPLAETGVHSANPPTKGMPLAWYESWGAAWQRLFGYDFFISYAWADGRPYAEALEKGLGAPPRTGFGAPRPEGGGRGEAWRTSVRKALRRSSVMVLVASSAALERDSVFEEVQTFARRNHPLIPIDVGGSVSARRGTIASVRILRSGFVSRRKMAPPVSRGASLPRAL